MAGAAAEVAPLVPSATASRRRVAVLQEHSTKQKDSREPSRRNASWRDRTRAPFVSRPPLVFQRRNIPGLPT